MDNEKVTIQVEDLRRAFSVLLDTIVANFGSTVTLCERTFEADHYWDLELGAAFRLVDHPELHIVAGQTSDDVEEVRDVVEREGGEVFLWHDLDHLAGVLRRIAFLDVPVQGNPRSVRQEHRQE